MPTVLSLSPMQLGSDVPVRQLHARVPVAALDRGAGRERRVAGIGSGFDALELTVADGDVQEQFPHCCASRLPIRWQRRGWKAGSQ